jgi:hypothetical protein
MKVLILYRKNAEEARQVEEFIHDLTKWHPDSNIEVIDYDSRDGIATASLYDILVQPAILALADDGQLLKIWTDELPLMNDVAR